MCSALSPRDYAETDKNPQAIRVDVSRDKVERLTLMLPDVKARRSL